MLSSAATFIWRECLETSVFCICTDSAFQLSRGSQNVPERCTCNTRRLRSLSFWRLPANVPLFISNEVALWCFSPHWRTSLLLLRSSHLVFAFSLSVLWSDPDWAGHLTSLGGGLPGKLSPGSAVELRGGVRQGGVCHAGSSAGEGPWGTVLCTSEEHACSAGHLHVRAPTPGALPRQAERLKYYCSESVRRGCVQVCVCEWRDALAATHRRVCLCHYILPICPSIHSGVYRMKYRLLKKLFIDWV